MTDDRTPNTGNIPTQERNPSLGQRTITVFRLPQRGIDIIHRCLEGCKFHHCIRDLPPPKRLQTLIQPPHPFRLRHLAPSLPHCMCKRRQRGLHPHLYCLEGTEGHISEELSRCGSAEVDNGFRCVGKEFVAVQVLEYFVETVLSGALEGVADEGGRPAEENSSQAFFAVDTAPRLNVGGVDFGIDLAAAFHLLGEHV